MKQVLEMLPKTRDYIEQTSPDERKGHHVYVAKQAVLNEVITIYDMTEEQIEHLDTAIIKYLVHLDMSGTSGFSMSYVTSRLLELAIETLELYELSDELNEVKVSSAKEFLNLVKAKRGEK